LEGGSKSIGVLSIGVGDADEKEALDEQTEEEGDGDGDITEEFSEDKRTIKRRVGEELVLLLEGRGVDVGVDERSSHIVIVIPSNSVVVIFFFLAVL